MKSLKELGFQIDDDVFKLSFEICHIAATAAINDEKLTKATREITSSYYYQWKFVLQSYEQLLNIYRELETKSSNGIISELDIFYLKKRIEIEHHSYLLIISLKALLDLFVCLLDLIQNKRNDKPDFFKFNPNGPKTIFEIPSLQSKMEISKKIDSFKQIQEYRNCLIHRGYHLNPQSPSNTLKNHSIMVGFYDSILNERQDIIVINQLFGDFIKEKWQMEKDISAILKRSGIIKKITKACKFEFAPLVHIYSVTDVS